MAIRLPKKIEAAIKAAREGDKDSLTGIVVPKMRGGQLIKEDGSDSDDQPAGLTRRFFLSDNTVDRDKDTIAGDGAFLRQRRNCEQQACQYDQRQGRCAAHPLISTTTPSSAQSYNWAALAVLIKMQPYVTWWPRLPVHNKFCPSRVGKP